jgi:prolyl 4-hydroxylase
MNKVMFHYYIEPKVIPDLLTEDEIEYIKKESINKLKPSTIDEGKILKSIRKSETAWLNIKDPIIRSVIEKCASRKDKPFTHCENLQVVRYKSGGYYKPHHDSNPTWKNPRIYTFIMALNDEYEGGETSFPKLNIKFKLKKGDCLFFHTLDNYEAFTSMALHDGQPVKSGEKWVCNLWVHKYLIPESHHAQ